MKKTYKFEIGETTVNREAADLLRSKVLEIICSKDIGTEPIQYERLLIDITSKMIELMQFYDFIFDGQNVDFTKENFAMFKSKVLKTFLSIKKDADTITLQKKNLDILSFYTLGAPWSEVYKKESTNNHHIEENHEKFIKVNPKSKPKIIITITLILIFFLSSIYILSKYIELKNITDEREIKYRSALKSLTEVFYKYVQFDEKYYDTLSTPKDGFIARLQFDDNLISYKNYPYSYDVIISKRGSSIKSEPGIKYCGQFNKMKAFGFGLRNCISGCYKPIHDIPDNEQPNTTTLRIKMNKKYFLTYIALKWIEVGYNWGSQGKVYVNGKQIGKEPYQIIGNCPPSNMLVDEQIRSFKAAINEYSDQIDIVVIDIANESEIFINDINIWGK